ncbi:hypothetical protein BDZ89DRAFT_136933 [Hymenopellis radicata]|nr:hypothetical protein BDZ89DRAFT_136933 [Hymenopellis radicata]
MQWNTFWTAAVIWRFSSSCSSFSWILCRQGMRSSIAWYMMIDGWSFFAIQSPSETVMPAKKIPFGEWGSSLLVFKATLDVCVPLAVQARYRLHSETAVVTVTAFELDLKAKFGEHAQLLYDDLGGRALKFVGLTMTRGIPKIHLTHRGNASFLSAICGRLSTVCLIAKACT